MKSTSLSPHVPVMSALIVVALGGCFGHLQQSTAGFPGLQAPVLLGPVDHIGEGQALGKTKVRGFSAKAWSSHTESKSGDYSVTTIVTNNARIVVEAVKALAGVGNADIRLSEIRADAWGWINKIASSVEVEGAVYKVGGLK